MILSRTDLVTLTGRKYASWQARELEHLKIPYKRRTDGSLVVLRSDVDGKQDATKREPQLRMA